MVREAAPPLSKGDVRGRLAGKVALVTGAGGGQGREVSLLFARAGAKVVGCDVRGDAFASIRQAAGEEGLELDLSTIDAANESETRDWVDRAAETYGGIDVLYNNAGFAHFAPIESLSLDQWRETLKNELDIIFLPTRAAWPHMVARGGASIINIASIGGVRGGEGVGAAAHAAGKGGVLGFTNQLAAEGAAHWIRANAISPGPIMTPATAALLESHPRFRQTFERQTLLRRAGQPIDVAYAGLFLASDESAWITGANITVDGGAICKVGLSIGE